MVGSELATIGFGLAAAVCWGAGDFSGGLATKHNSVYSVTVVSQLIGLLLLPGLVLLVGDPLPPVVDMLWGGFAGIFGALGLVVFYRGLAMGRMGVIAPVTSVMTAAIPVAFGLLTAGLPETHRLIGIIIAFFAVWFVSQSDGGQELDRYSLGVGLLAGITFGVFFIFLDRASSTTATWPLIATRFASLSMLFVAARFRSQPVGLPRQRVGVVMLAGLFDTGGNVFFALAAHAGRLDIAAVLSSFYSAGTVLLAWIILKEPVSRRQGVGIIAALVAVTLISA